MTEPEEIIEAKVAALLAAANPGFEVVGALAAAPDGVEKVAPLSHIGVVADLSAQNLDWIGPGVPCTYQLRVAVRVAFADDKTGSRFRSACRAVRAALLSATGDECDALDGDGFSCDALTLDSTVTALESLGDGDGMNKTYTATVSGRYTPTTTETEAENG